MKVDDRRLSDFLFDAGLLSRGELARAEELAAERVQPLSETLVQAGIVQDDDVRRALAHVLGIPFVHVRKDMLDAEALMLLPESFARAHQAIVLTQGSDAIEVALLSMQDLTAVQAQLPQGRRVHPRLTTRESLRLALLHYQKLLKEKFGSLLSEEIAKMQASHAAGDAGAHDATVRAADALLRHALHQHADEIHLEPGVAHLRVRYRIGSELFDAMTLPPVSITPLISRLKLLAQLPLTSETPGIGRFKIAPERNSGGHVLVNVSTVPVVHEGAASERMQLSFSREAHGKKGLSLASLGFTPANAHMLRRVLSRRQGLVLVSGAAGSGKTTLLYTLLDELGATSLHAASVEERVSYSLPSVAQMELHHEHGLNAASSIRAQLKQNPDILMIDCLLDEEVALLAAEAANRGVLVLLGVGAFSAAEALEQLLALGVGLELVSSTVTASIGLRALPKLCSHSRTEHRLSRTEQTLLEETTDIKNVLVALREDQVLDSGRAWKDIPLYDAVACVQCEDGYMGAVGVQEIMPMSRAIQDVVRGGGGMDELRMQAQREGMMTLREDTLYKTIQGLLSVEELLEVATG